MFNMLPSTMAFDASMNPSFSEPAHHHQYVGRQCMSYVLAVEFQGVPAALEASDGLWEGMHVFTYNICENCAWSVWLWHGCVWILENKCMIT
jgi:hypothetical protein